MFLLCHIRHLNLIDKNPQRITKKDKELASKLNYEKINFPLSKKDYCKIEVQNNICINVFRYENKVIYPIYLLDQKFSDSMDLLLISDKCKSHYVHIKDFDRSMFNKTKCKDKKYFCKNCLQCFSSEEILREHKEDCLVTNGKQSVKLESGFISFKNYSKQIPVPFKIYADFECILKKVDGDIECSPNSPNSSTLEPYDNLKKYIIKANPNNSIFEKVNNFNQTSKSEIDENILLYFDL